MRGGFLTGFIHRLFVLPCFDMLKLLMMRRNGWVLVFAVLVAAAIGIYVWLKPTAFKLPGNMSQGFVVDKKPVFFGSTVFHNVGPDSKNSYDYVEYTSSKSSADIKKLFDDFFIKNNWTIASEGGDAQSGYVIIATINDPKLGYANAPITQASVSLAPLPTSTKVMINYFHTNVQPITIGTSSPVKE